LESINPEAYPYLKLQYSLDDPQASVPEQLRKWQVSYTGVPEGVLILKDKRENLQLDESEEEEENCEFMKISKLDVTDSLTVAWTLNNTGQRKTEKFNLKIPAVKAGQSHPFTIKFNSLGRVGKTSLNVFANPHEYQEQTFRNNVMDLPD